MLEEYENFSTPPENIEGASDLTLLNMYQKVRL